jgi:glutathione S-transferase
MAEHLAENIFFVGNYSIADIALFAFTGVFHEVNFLFDDFSKIRNWIERVKGQPKFIPMI